VRRILIAAILVLGANNALAQEILPKAPSGPKIRTNHIEDYLSKIETKKDAIASMVNFYKAKDYQSALDIAIQEAKKNDKDACALAGYIYEMGLGKPAPNYENAALYYLKGAKAGSRDAMVGLGRLAALGAGNIGILEATSALEVAIDEKRDDAIMPMADLLVKSGVDKARAFSLYQSLANAQNPEAAYKAAILLDDGENGVPDNLVLAYKYLEQAAEGQITSAQVDLGTYYYFGKGTPKNLEAAAKYFKLAALNNDEQGAFYWALVNAKGEGVARDFPTALKYAEIAKAKVPQAQRLYDQLQKYMAQK
jgi:uncharacterized protein